MRVLHVIPGVAPRYGGPSSTIWPMIAALNRLKGTTAELATTDADGPGGRLDLQSIPAGIEVHVFRRSASEQWKYSRGLARWLRRHTRDYDVVHVHSIWSFPTAAAARAAQRAGVPYIVRPAGMLSQYCLNFKAIKKRLYWFLIEGRTIHRAAGFHATGTGEIKDIESLRPGARSFLIPPAIESEAFIVPANLGDLRRRCGPGVGARPIVLFLGRLHPVKGLTDFLLPAFARLRSDAFLAIAGGPDQAAAGYDRAVRQMIEHLGLKNRVAMLGAVTTAERWQLFDGASVFVLPSHSENFGMVVAEALARGCPTVVTEGVQSHSVVTASGAGRVVPPDPVPVAEALDSILAAPIASKEHGAAGRRYVAEHLTWDRIASQIATMYQDIIQTCPLKTILP